MNNDFGKSESDALSLISNIQIKVKTEEAKKENLSPLKTVEKLFSDIDIQALGTMIKVISAFTKFYSYIPGKEDPSTWKDTTDGYALILDGYYKHPSAIEFSEFLEKAKVLKDVLDRILKFENISLDEYLSYIPNLDKDWFLKQISEENLFKFLVIAGNKEEYDLNTKKVLDEIAESHSKVMEAEMLHNTLMKD